MMELEGIVARVLVSVELRPVQVVSELTEIRHPVHPRHHECQNDHADRRLVEQENRRTRTQDLHLSANVQLIQSRNAESCCCDDCSDRVCNGLFRIRHRNTKTACAYSNQTHSVGGDAEHEVLEKDDAGSCEDLGQLEETDRVESKREVGEDDAGGEEEGDWE